MASFTALIIAALFALSSCSPLFTTTTHWEESSITSSSAASATDTFYLTSTRAGDCVTHTTETCTKSSCATAKDGPIPSGILPESLSPADLDAFQGLLFLEHLESALFSTAATNFSTWDTHGSSNNLEIIINQVASQEDTYVQTLESLIGNYGMVPIRPCNYSFPVSSWNDFLFLAQKLTTVGVSALIGLSGDLAESTPSLASTLSSILTVKARHDAFLLLENSQVPNPKAFDTGIHMLWAQNLVLQYITPGSCPDGLAMPVLPILQVRFNSSQESQSERRIDFSWDASQMPFTAEASAPLSAAWVSQLSEPIYTNVTMNGTGQGYSIAPDSLMGQAFVALTSRQPTDKWSLELATLSGPALIELV